MCRGPSRSVARHDAGQRPRVRRSSGSELAALRRRVKSNGRPDESCADPADILVGIAVLETPLLIKSQMSQTQGERMGMTSSPSLFNKIWRAICARIPPNMPGDAETTAATFPANTSRPVGIAFTWATGPIKGVLQRSVQRRGQSARAG
jgi:hypothetical protein